MFRRYFPLLVGFAAAAAACGTVLGFVLPRTTGVQPVSIPVRLIVGAVLMIALVVLALERNDPIRRRVLWAAFFGLAAAAALYGADTGQAISARVTLLVAAAALLIICVAVTAIRADQPRPTQAARL